MRAFSICAVEVEIAIFKSTLIAKLTRILNTPNKILLYFSGRALNPLNPSFARDGQHQSGDLSFYANVKIADRHDSAFNVPIVMLKDYSWLFITIRVKVVLLFFAIKGQLKIFAAGSSSRCCGGTP